MNAVVKARSTDIMGHGFTPEKVELVKRTIAVGATNDELELFLAQCKRTGLDPFVKQIYCIKRGGRATIQTGIDGFRLIAERTGNYAPGPEPRFTYKEDGRLESATASVIKIVGAKEYTVSATAFYDEYVQVYNEKPSGLWEKMPRTMLAKCAEALAIRKAFPDALSGIYSTEEMMQADNEAITVSTAPAKTPPPIDETVEFMLEKLREEYLPQFRKSALEENLKLADKLERWLNNPVKHTKANVKKTFELTIKAVQAMKEAEPPAPPAPPEAPKATPTETPKEPPAEIDEEAASLFEGAFE